MSNAWQISEMPIRQRLNRQKRPQASLAGHMTRFAMHNAVAFVFRGCARVSCRMHSSRVFAAVALAALTACASPPASSPGPRVYISDETGTEVVVVDPAAAKVLQKIAIGK